MLLGWDKEPSLQSSCSQPQMFDRNRIGLKDKMPTGCKDGRLFLSGRQEANVTVENKWHMDVVALSLRLLSTAPGRCGLEERAKDF